MPRTNQCHILQLQSPINVQNSETSTNNKGERKITQGEHTVFIQFLISPTDRTMVHAEDRFNNLAAVRTLFLPEAYYKL